MQKLFSKICLAIGITGLFSCSLFTDDDISSGKQSSAVFYNGEFNGIEMSPDEARRFASDPTAAASIFNKRVPPLNSLIVCRDKQCAPAELSKSKEYIFNALAQLIDNNLDKTALLCEGNAQTHVCTNPYLTVPAKIGVTPAYVFFDGVKIVDASIAEGKTAFNLILDYNLSYNGQTPSVCKPDTSMLYVKSNNQIVLNGNGFKCDMTSMGVTMIRVMFSVDYVDLDYGYIGGYYSIGLSGPAYGGGSGYGLIRLQKDAHPLNPVLQAPQQEEDDVYTPEVKASVKPSFNSDALSLEDETAAKAVAPVEIKDAAEKQVPQNNAPAFSERKPIQYNDFENTDNRDYVNSSQPFVERPETPTVFVTEGGIIADENAPRTQDADFGPEFEEVYVEDLDEYIK